MHRACGPDAAHADSLRLVPLLDPLIQRLQNSRVHCGNDIYRRIEFFFSHSRFPCVRKAPLHSRIAEPHHRDRQTNQHLLALGEASDGMSVTVEGTEICLF